MTHAEQDEAKRAIRAALERMTAPLLTRIKELEREADVLRIKLSAAHNDLYAARQRLADMERGKDYPSQQ